MRAEIMGNEIESRKLNFYIQYQQMRQRPINAQASSIVEQGHEEDNDEQQPI